MDDAAQRIIVRQNHPRTHTLWKIKHESLDKQSCQMMPLQPNPMAFCMSEKLKSELKIDMYTWRHM
jgi:hypothetical protein